MGWAAVTAALLAATPVFHTQGDVTPEAALRAEAEAAWKELEARYLAEAGGAPPQAPAPIRLQRGLGLAPERNAQGKPGLVELRQNTPGVLDERLRLALRHELAHQLLWWACPAASEDRLFHEAFALVASGELPEWREGPYQSLTVAASELARAPAVDSPRARRALARILGEDRGFPKALSRRLKQCQDGARWVVPLSIDELADVTVQAAAPATVVVSRHSGEVLLLRGRRAASAALRLHAEALRPRGQRSAAAAVPTPGSTGVGLWPGATQAGGRAHGAAALLQRVLPGLGGARWSPGGLRSLGRGAGLGGADGHSRRTWRMPSACAPRWRSHRGAWRRRTGCWPRPAPSSSSR